MKKLVLVVGIIIAMSSLASAEILLTANPLGKGNWAWCGAGSYASSSLANANMYGIGGFVGYGINDKIEVYGKLGYGIGANPPSGLTANGIQDALVGKYNIIGEGEKCPVSVAAIVGYQWVTQNVSPISFQTVQGDLGIGVLASKIMIPWVPYAGIGYHNIANNSVSGSTTGSNIEIVLGSQMLLSKSSAIIGELSLNSYNVGSTYTNTQISIGYQATI